MRILVDIGHPGHVHLFRNAIKAWIARGHTVVITIRDRQLVGELLDQYGLSYEIASRVKTSFAGLIYELLEHDWNVLRATLKHRIDVLIGTSVCITHVGLVTRRPAVVFNEDDRDYLHAWAWLAYPFAHAIVAPACLRDEKTPKYICHNSLHELAYLHPDHYTPDPGVLARLGVAPGERYFIVRFVALQAHHDFKHRGLSLPARRRLVNLLAAHGRVFITNEGRMPTEFQPYQFSIPASDMHHAMSFATLFVGDSQTMTVEAAALGTPALRCNTFHDRCSIINEIEQRYRLTASFHPDDEERMLERVEELLRNPALKSEWRERRDRMLREKSDFSAWMVSLVENLRNVGGRFRYEAPGSQR